MGASGDLKGVRSHRVKYKDEMGSHTNIVCDAHLPRYAKKKDAIVQKHVTSKACEMMGEHKYSKS